MGDPDLSVVVVVDEERERGARCLHSLLAQSNVDRLEVLVVDLASQHSALPGTDHPHVRVLALPPTMWYGELHAEAVRQARAPVIAFLEEHCVALPGWAEALVEAHKSSVAAVGGERHEPAFGPPLARFVQLLDRGPWSPPAVNQATRWLPGGNVAYKRDVLLRYGDRLDLYLESEGIFQEQLYADGLTLRVAPLAKYLHDSDVSLGGLCRRWYGQAHMAATVRAALRGGSRMPGAEDATRWVKGLAVGPALLLRLLSNRSVDRGLVLTHAHVAALLSLTSVAGDIAGMLKRRPASDARLRDQLINAKRQ